MKTSVSPEEKLAAANCAPGSIEAYESSNQPSSESVFRQARLEFLYTYRKLEPRPWDRRELTLESRNMNIKEALDVIEEGKKNKIGGKYAEAACFLAEEVVWLNEQMEDFIKKITDTKDDLYVVLKRMNSTLCLSIVDSVYQKENQNDRT